MAVQIIGVDPRRFKECTCSNCASRLRYTDSDRTSQKISDYTGDTEINFFITCPQCGYIINVGRF